MRRKGNQNALVDCDLTCVPIQYLEGQIRQITSQLTAHTIQAITTAPLIHECLKSLLVKPFIILNIHPHRKDEGLEACNS